MVSSNGSCMKNEKNKTGLSSHKGTIVHNTKYIYMENDKGNGL